MTLHNKCILCNSNELIPLNRYYSEHSLIKCNNCKLVFAHKIPSEIELEKHYSSYSYENVAEISISTKHSYSKLLDQFEKYRKNNRILDVGCGRGWFLTEAKNRGWEVYGNEYSEKAVELCTNNGINTTLGALNETLFEPDFFDVVTSFEVIEHINNPNEDLKLIHQFLRSDGLFYCTTPNFNSIMRYYLKEKYNVIEYPEHLTYYTHKTLNQALKLNKFEKIKLFSTGFSLSRIKQSLSSSPTVHNSNSDERLRENITSKWYLKLAKSMANSFFKISRTGLTLKAYYTKK